MGKVGGGTPRGEQPQILMETATPAIFGAESPGEARASIAQPDFMTNPGFLMDFAPNFIIWADVFQLRPLPDPSPSRPVRP